MNLNQREVDVYKSRTELSKKLWEKTKTLIPMGHGGGMGYQLPYPVMIEKGKGCWIWDVDGNRYLDLRIGDWVLIHGYCDDDINNAVAAQMAKATQVGGPEWDVGYRMAKLLVERMPSVEKVRFFTSGTETNNFAIRMARVFTGKLKIAKTEASYHGVGDILLVGTSIIRDTKQWLPTGIMPSVGEEVVEIPYNDPDGAEAVLERHGHEIAAILIEPVLGAAGMIPATTEYLQRLRDVATRKNILLIFDEVVTFPVAYGGAQAHHKVTPDLTTMSKAIGGGLPAAAIGGRADIMDLLEPDAHNGQAPLAAAATFGGNMAALAAGIAALEKLTPEAHDKVNALGKRAMAGIDALGKRYSIPLHATGLGHLFAMHWAPEKVCDLRTRLMDDREKLVNINLGLMNDGYYQMYFGSFLLSTAHGEQEIDDFLAAMENVLHRLEYVS